MRSVPDVRRPFSFAVPADRWARPSVSGAGISRVRTSSFVALVVLVTLAMPGGAGAATPTATVARELQRSPLFVDPAFADTVPPALQARLARSARTAPGRVRIALVPLVAGDQYNGDARAFLTAVRARLPARERDGIFVAAEDRYLRVVTFRDGERDDGATVEAALQLANEASGRDYDRSYAERVAVFLREIRRSPAELAAAVKAQDEAQRRRSARYARENGERSADGGDGAPGWIVPVVALLVVGLGAALVVLVARRTRRGARAAQAPLPVLPDRVFEHARAAQRADLAEDADRELLGLAALLDEAPVPSSSSAQDAYQRALDAYTAARRRMTADAPTVELVGVLVLVDHARDHLAQAAALDAGRRPPARTPLCFFNPLHGRSARRVAWGDGLRVPACAACAADVRARRTPDALRDGGRPYFEGDTVWARTGYGAFEDDLVGLVARGGR